MVIQISSERLLSSLSGRGQHCRATNFQAHNGLVGCQAVHSAFRHRDDFFPPPAQRTNWHINSGISPGRLSISSARRRMKSFSGIFDDFGSEKDDQFDDVSCISDAEKFAKPGISPRKGMQSLESSVFLRLKPPMTTVCPSGMLDLVGDIAPCTRGD